MPATKATQVRVLRQFLNDELESMWNEVTIVYFKVSSFLKLMRKTTKSSDSGRDFNSLNRKQMQLFSSGIS
jgi:hypothetical protein